ncbi:MAG: class I SAM-dependent methyltransferase [Nanoarchaeota archaeon]|nr:class I SAM-dependent methyltransferase [Nanoarchaeota archaeon]
MNQEQVWNSIAESWTNFRQKPKKELYNLNWKKGNLLDVGCGNCKNLLPFKNLDLYGIDFSSEMLKQAKKFCEKHNLKVALKKADMRKLPFKDNFFDYILCLASLHHINKKDADKSLKEIYRVLKKKGQCFISVWNKLQFRFLFKKKETYILWNKYRRYYCLYNPLELKKLLLKNKFKIIKSGKIFDKNIKFLIQK